MNKSYICQVVGALFSLLAACTHSPAGGVKEERSDSLYTKEHIMTIYMKEPQRALGLIDTAVMRGLISNFRGDDLRAMICQGPLHDLSRAMEYCQRISLLDSVVQVPGFHIALLTRMSGLAFDMGDYEKCIQYATEGSKVANSIDKPVSEGRFLFFIGESLMHIGQKQSAWVYLKKGVRLSEESRNPNAMPYLSYFYGELMSYFAQDCDFSNAVVIGEKRAELITSMKQACFKPQGYIDQQYGYLYSKLAYYYAMLGNNHKAESYVAKFWQTNFSYQPEGKRELLDYYRVTNQHKEVMRIYDETSNFLPQDTISSVFIVELRNKAQAHEMLGHTKVALNLERRIEVIKDSLFQRKWQSEALKLATVYQTYEKDLQLKESRIESQRSSLIAILMCGLFVAVSVVASVFYAYSRVILRKNRVLLNQMDDLEDCRSQLNEAREKVRVLSVGIRKEEKDIQDEKESMNAQLFKKLEEIMERDHLFLMKDLTRETVMQRLHIDKNRLSQMFQETAGGVGLPAYVNDFRLKWAICLLKENPDFTIRAIAEDSGFSSLRSFQRLFKEKIKMTPAEYRAAIAK